MLNGAGVFVAAGSGTDPNVKSYRHRKSHTKSRGGCIACKAGRRKCDEVRPSCGRCLRRNATCTYASPASKASGDARPETATLSPDLELSGVASTAALIDASLAGGMEASSTALTRTPTSGRSSPSFSSTDVASLTLFEKTTCFTLVSPAIWTGYSTVLVKLALGRPYLMHTMLALSQLHQDWLKGASYPSSRVLFHWQSALTSFNRCLSKAIICDDAVAVFSTSTLVNSLAVALRPRVDPSRSWPMTGDRSSLQWLYIQQGPGRLLAQLGPWLVGDVLGPGIDFFNEESTPSDGAESPTPPPTELLGLVELTDGNSAATEALSALIPLHSIPPCPNLVARYLEWIGSVPTPYIDLLSDKDPVALLILGYWYLLVMGLDQWWLTDRARTEAVSICMYLEQHPDNRVREALVPLARACGYNLVWEEMEFERADPVGDLNCRIM